MIIGTPIEVENYLIKSNKYDFNNIIIDEIHCLNNNTTQEQIEYANAIKRLMMILSGQFLFLSATLTDESMENLKSYIEIIKDEECKVIKHTERFINLQFHIMNQKKTIENVNPFSQIDLSEISEFKGKNMFYYKFRHLEFLGSSKDEDGDRFIEIWNLVFMQFEQITKDERINLPKPSIDTGMGLERITAILQNTNDNYKTDIFTSLIDKSIELSNSDENHDSPSHRVIADHLRSASFLISEGVLPSNEGRGYVLRRIMRRGMRHAHSLGNTEPVFDKIFPTLLINDMKKAIS